MGESIYTNQIYAFNLKIVLLACFLLLVTAGGGLCQDDKEKKTPISNKMPTKPEAEISIKIEPAEMVQKAMKNWLAARSFRASAVFTDRRDKEYKIEAEFVAPNRLRMVTQLIGEQIFIGGAEYIKSAKASRWEKSKPDFFKEIIDSRYEALYNEIFEGSRKYKSEYEVFKAETLNGIPTVVYLARTGKLGKVLLEGEEKDEERMSHRIKLWIGFRDNVLYRVEVIEDEAVSASFKFPVPFKKQTVNFYDYGADIKIEPPI